VSVRAATALALTAALLAGGCGAAEKSTTGTPESAGCVDRAAFETDEPEDGGPSWSPDGRRIAFHSTRNGDYELWTIDVDTCATKRLTSGVDPDWSTDGARLVFIRFGPDGLWTADSNNGDLRPVSEGFLDSFPAWSPRDDLIAFDRNTIDEAKGVDRREIHVVRSDGTNLRRLTEGGWHVTPAFSPDGARLAWTRGDTIWRMRTDGTDLQQVTKGGGNGDTEPSWAPDGEKIAFTRSTYEMGLQPWLVELESGEERPLVDVPGSTPDWSPDGKWVVFTRDDRDGRFLSLVRPDGTGLRPLTAPAGG
jgi:Tol biopolymer transport system component